MDYYIVTGEFLQVGECEGKALVIALGNLEHPVFERILTVGFTESNVVAEDVAIPGIARGWLTFKRTVVKHQFFDIRIIIITVNNIIGLLALPARILGLIFHFGLSPLLIGVLQ